MEHDLAVVERLVNSFRARVSVHNIKTTPVAYEEKVFFKVNIRIHEMKRLLE